MVPIDFSYTTSYGLSIVTFAPRTHRLVTTHNVTGTTDGRITVA